jgi:hypothetical protein
MAEPQASQQRVASFTQYTPYRQRTPGAVAAPSGSYLPDDTLMGRQFTIIPLRKAIPLVFILTLVWGTTWPLFPAAVREVSAWTVPAPTRPC